ncbi:stage V sporulation protein AA [Gracilibacillus boraciitolerans JCM 21714]|uniref:Stage V sporulation protein AA n=1 Tax=Gracilibacillus boraciitolerans JCM 21714 TaxID=1298598 RepID=W4VD18_9BACI|nr:stage V sporulation protein AA [Gracilibacillus boraciitolerans]GAE91305.1 stage V sporulation protein AA [Gracilibacillus boraciitolerans JCM 21714]
MEEEKVYIRLKKKIAVASTQLIRLRDISYITGNISYLPQVENLKIYQITEEDKNVSIIDGFHLLKTLVHQYPFLTVELLGATQVIIEIKKNNKKANIFIILLVWLLLCIGSAMAIINFHYDVSMKEVHQGLYYLLTGEKIEKPLWIQIPYSIGLGLGMILFFNHIFKKRFNEEPSPLEVEMFNYQQDLDNYLIYHENSLNKQHDT